MSGLLAATCELHLMNREVKLYDCCYVYTLHNSTDSDKISTIAA